jgi:hypothetical protein
MNQSLYGELQTEKITEDKKVAVQIVDEINKFGISDRQRWMVIHLLSLEIEDVQDMKEMVNFIKSKKEKDIFVSKLYAAGEDNWTEQEVEK